MSSFSFVKWCGFFGMLGGLAYLPSRFFIHPSYDGSIEGLIGWGLDTAAVTCSLLLITAMHLIQGHKTGKFGMFSYFFLFLLSAIWAGHQYGLLLLAPVIHQIDPQFFLANSEPPLRFLIPTIANVLFKAIAFLLFASASLKARILPRWALIVLIAGTIVDFVPMGDYLGRILFGISFIGIGLALWKGTTEQPLVSVHQDGSEGEFIHPIRK